MTYNSLFCDDGFRRWWKHLGSECLWVIVRVGSNPVCWWERIREVRNSGHDIRRNQLFININWCSSRNLEFYGVMLYFIHSKLHMFYNFTPLKLKSVSYDRQPNIVWLCFFLVISLMPLQSHCKYRWQNTSKDQVSAFNHDLILLSRGKGIFFTPCLKEQKVRPFLFPNVPSFLPIKQITPSIFLQNADFCQA